MSQEKRVEGMMPFMTLSLRSEPAKIQEEKHISHLLKEISKSQVDGKYYYDHLWKKQSATQMVINPVISYIVPAPC